MEDFDECVIRQKIAKDGFNNITAERWQSVCEHVKKVEVKYWARDYLCESEVEKLINILSEDSSNEKD